MSEEYISREAVKQLLRMEMKFSLEAMVADPEVIPSADVRPNIHAEWEKPAGKIQPFGEDTRQCTGCGFFTERDSCDIYNFCPNCGADMREPKGGERNRMTKEAIEYFESQKKELEYFREMYPSPEDKGYKDTTKEIGFVDMAISALSENKGEWIPVIERLPESSGVYTVSRWFSDGEERAILTDANYYDGCGNWYNDNRINWGRELVTDKIVAWMPKPEPYKKGE